MSTKSAPPKPPLMRVGVNGDASQYTCPLCGSGMKPKGPFGNLFKVFKEGYMRNAPKNVTTLRPAAPKPMKTNKAVSDMTINIETTILEDGSIWYRMNNIKTDVMGEWIKLEG